MLKMNEVTRVRTVSYTSRSSQPTKLAIALWCHRLRNRELYDFAVFQTTHHRPSVVRSGFIVASCNEGFRGRAYTFMAKIMHRCNMRHLFFLPENVYAETWPMRCVIIYNRIPALGARAYRAISMFILMNATAHALFQTHVQLITISQHSLQ